MAVHEENFQVYPEALAPGTVVNGWRIRRRLGVGGFGAAYLVESTARPGEFFALKIARRLVDERVGREIALLMTWAVHPHVVRLHAFGRWPHPETGYLFFVMDWVQGLPLHTWAETHNPSIRAAVEKLATVALTLEHLHAEGVLHRDLKPEHMLVRDSDGKPVLIDFGGGWYEGADTLTTQGMAPGTPHLRSPEAMAFWRKHGGRQGQRYTYKPSDDLYALGVTAYRVLTGHWPFPPHLDREALSGVIEALAPPAPSAINNRLPRPVGDVILRMMAKKPQHRFQSSGEAHVALVAALTFAGSDVVEAELFDWEKPAEPQPPSPAPEPKVRLPEWPTLPKSSQQAPRAKPPAAPVAQVEPPPSRGHRAWVLAAVLMLGLAGAAALGGRTLGQVETHPTPEVGKKSSALAGQKLALEPEWVEPFWAAVPHRDPTPAVVVSTTNPEDSSTVQKTQKVTLTTGQQVPEHHDEKPPQKPLEGARKALAAAATCTLLTGCAGLPALPPIGESCPPEAVAAMKELKMYAGLELRPLEYLDYGDNHHVMPVRETERFAWETNWSGSAKLPKGTQFIGRLWVRDRLYARVERIVTPDHHEYPVCLELARSVIIPRTVSNEPDHARWAPGADLAEPKAEPGGLGYVDIHNLYFMPVGRWGDLN